MNKKKVKIQSKLKIRRLCSAAVVDVRATLDSTDILAGRTVWQHSSDVQEFPKGDNRYRVTHSEKFYIVQLMGSWVNVSDFAERTVVYKNRLKWVRFEKKEYQLRGGKNLKSFIRYFIRNGCYAIVGSKQISSEKELDKIVDYPFIYIASSEALRKFHNLGKKEK